MSPSLLWAWSPEGLAPFDALRFRLVWRGLLASAAFALVGMSVQLALDPALLVLSVVPAGGVLALIGLFRAGHHELAAALQALGWLLLLALVQDPTGGLGSTLFVFETLAVLWSVVALRPGLALVSVAGHVGIVLFPEALASPWEGGRWVDEASLAPALWASHAVAVAMSAGLVGVLFDTVTRAEADAELMEAEARAARRLAEASAHERSRFLGTMSHELRTPLNAVMGYADLLAEEADDNAEELRALHAAGAHLLDLVDDVLEVARSDVRTPDPAARTSLRTVLDELGVHRRSGFAVLPRTLPELALPRDVVVRILRNLWSGAPPRGSDGSEPRALVAETTGTEVEVRIARTGAPRIHELVASRLLEQHGGELVIKPDGYRLRLPAGASAEDA